MYAGLALLLLPIMLGIGPFGDASWQNLFCKIAIFGLADIIECDNMKDTLTFKAGQDIAISLDNTTDTITIAATVQKFDENGTNLGTSGATIFRGESGHIWNFARIYNGTNTTITENGTGVIISATGGGSGEANTGANVGTGEGTVFRDKTGVTLNFKTLKQSDNIVLTNNADEVTIRGVNTAQIASAGGTPLFKSRDNATQNTIKGLTTTRGITLTANTNDVQIDTNFKVNSKSPATRQFLTSFNNATTDGNFGTIIFGVNSQTCSAGQHISAINNSTGFVTCSADQSGVSDGDKGDITVSGGGATWTIDNDVVTFAKMQNIATDRLLGRDTAGSGDPEELTVSGGLEFTGSGGIQTSAFTGDVEKSAGGTTTTISNNAVTDAKLRDSTALSVIGRASNSAGDPADISATANDTLLRRVSNALSFGQLTVGMVPDDLITYAKMQNIANNNRFLGRISGAGGDPEELTGTQATSLLDTFTSSLKGLAPPSGGGTANFLRADGNWATPPDTTGILTINGDGATAQTFSGTANNVTITDTGAGSLTWNLGSNVVVTGGSDQTFTKNLLFGSLATIFGSDPADSGSIRLSNAGTIGWEASPASTDVTISVDSNEDFVISSSANNINLNSNPLINSILNIDSTGNQITASTNQAGDLLKSDGTEYQRFARGAAGTCLKVNAGGTDLEYGSCGSGGGGFTTITNLAGGTAKILATNSSGKAEFKSLTQGQGISITNGSSTVTVATNFKIDNLSNACSGTDKVSAITFNNSTGDWTVTCSADQTGAGGGGSGSGIPYNKLWGNFVARSTTGALDGFLTGATLDGTETYTYDTTLASSAISSASGITANNNAGLSQVATNTNVFRLDQNALLYAEWRMTEITTNRIFIGFQSGTTALPNAADDMLNTASGYGLCIQSTDTIYQVCRNDGSGATVFASLGVTEDTNRHTVKITADSANNQWCISLDGAANVCHTTDIPAATTRLYVSVSGETTDTSGTTFLYSKVYVQNDR